MELWLWYHSTCCWVFPIEIIPQSFRVGHVTCRESCRTSASVKCQVPVWSSPKRHVRHRFSSPVIAGVFFLSGFFKKEILWRWLIFNVFWGETVYQSPRDAQDLPRRALRGQLRMTVTFCPYFLSKSGLVCLIHTFCYISECVRVDCWFPVRLLSTSPGWGADWLSLWGTFPAL